MQKSDALVQAITLEKSTQWVQGLDRSVLGSFAVDSDSLAKVKIYYDYRAEKYPVREDIPSAMLELNDELNRMAPHTFNQARSELFFWWKYSGQPTLIEFIKYSTGETFEDIKRLELVVAYPDMLPYFEQGLWDVKDNQLFIDEGIDAYMASAMKR